MKSSLVLILFLLFAQPVLAVTAHWDDPNDPTIIGYRLYRAEGSCSSPSFFLYVQSYPPGTSGSVSIPTTSGVHCHFLVAYDSAGDSPNSNLAEYVYPTLPQCPSVSYCKTLKGQARKQCLACR